jgi:hypothetical protein
VDLSGAFYVSRAILQRMLYRGSGHIIMSTTPRTSPAGSG